MAFETARRQTQSHGPCTITGKALRRAAAKSRLVRMKLRATGPRRSLQRHTDTEFHVLSDVAGIGQMIVAPFIQEIY